MSLDAPWKSSDAKAAVLEQVAPFLEISYQSDFSEIQEPDREWMGLPDKGNVSDRFGAIGVIGESVDSRRGVGGPTGFRAPDQEDDVFAHWGDVGKLLVRVTSLGRECVGPRARLDRDDALPSSTRSLRRLAACSKRFLLYVFAHVAEKISSLGK